MKISIGVSNRHVHLTLDDLVKLFGENYKLEKKNDLTQPGQFASTALLTIKTEKSEINNVRVLGPIRDYTQIEISKTDSYKLGLKPPVRNSGDLIGSSPITLIGPNGQITKSEGCIIATRHIHISYDDIKKFNLENKKVVDVKINGEKGGIIRNVYLKPTKDAFFEMHLDTDDANAHLINNGDIGEIL